MDTVILGGPTLALSPSDTRYYTIINCDGAKQIATIAIDVPAKTRTLIINDPDNAEENVAAIMRLLLATIDAFSHIPIICRDTQGIVFAYMLNGTMDSKQQDIVKAWTKLNFELELTNEAKGTGNKVRFVGTNIQGIKQIAKASAVTLKITRK